MWNIELNHRLECSKLQRKDLVEQHPLLSLAKLDPSYFLEITTMFGSEVQMDIKHFRNVFYSTSAQMDKG